MIEMVRRLGGPRVVVVGDLIADEYVYGRVARVPAKRRCYPRVRLDGDRARRRGQCRQQCGGARRPGDAGVADRSRRTRPARRAGVAARVDRGSLVRPVGFLTLSRLASSPAGSIPPNNRWCASIACRRGRLTDEERTAVARAAHQALGKADAVLISDYGSGLVTPALAREFGADLAAVPSRCSSTHATRSRATAG